MERFRFPIAVAFTSLAVVVALVGAGGVLVGNALALGPFSGGGPWAPGHDAWQNGTLPPELAGLAGVPLAERFSHFRGVHVQLTDKDNHPLTVDITPGTATTVTATSLTIAVNDGSTRTFAFDDRTILRSKSAAPNAPQAATAAIGQNDKVVVATLDNSATATAVVSFNNADGFGPRGPFSH